MSQPITLNFYNDQDEIETTYARNRIPTYLLDAAIALQADLGDEQPTQEKVNSLYDFVVEFYGNKFTREDLKQKTDLVECMSIVGQILGRANQLAQQFAGNPTPPSRQKK